VDCLADEDFSLDAERRLGVSGHAVAAIVQDRPGSPDEEVLGRAAREDRVALTFERDYGRLLFGETGKPVPPGIVYFRFDPSPPEEPADLPLSPRSSRRISPSPASSPSSNATRCARDPCRKPADTESG
jgi:hypothetical protein